MVRKVILGMGCLALALMALAMYASHRRDRAIALTCYGALYETGKYQGIHVSEPVARRAIDDSRTAYTSRVWQCQSAATQRKLPSSRV